MNIENHLIFIKEEDKTEQIQYCQYLDGKWKVTYYTSNKTYTYHYRNIKWYKDPIKINPQTHMVYHHNEPIIGAMKIINFGSYVRIIFKTGYKRIYEKSSIVIEKTCLNNKASSNCFEYLKRLAHDVSIKSEEGGNFLSKQYSKITAISPRSVLATYLGKKPLIKQEPSPIQPIFPFGFNLSQKEAVKKALTNQLSVIEGPPGTGKTQTILNIIANAIIHNHTVAVVSNNNSATANVFEKLQKYDVDFIGAYLGNKDNKEQFFAQQKDEYPRMTAWELPDIDVKTMKENLRTSQQKLDKMLAYKNKQAMLKQELAGLETEGEYFSQYNHSSNMKGPKLSSLVPISAQSILKIILGYQRNVKNGRITISHKLYNLFAYGIYHFKFYNNQLIILTNEEENDRPLVLYKTVKGNHARGNFNQRQIDVIFQEILPQQKIDDKVQSVGIISPYRLQTEALQKAIGSRNIEADTVHKYQGREKDVIILTTVANQVKVNDFVDNPNLINVAVSRAIDQLILVVSEGSHQWTGTNIGDLVSYIQYNNFEVIESQIYSVFDLLYSAYSNELLGFIKSSKKVSEYESENLMNKIIEKVLGEPEFQHLDRVIHQPLRMLIKDTNKLNKDEYRYAMNVLTHTDFVIFNKVDKKPVLVIEVDGYAYHANNPKQLKRDKMKDEILREYGIPMLRVGTNESGEESRLREELKKNLKFIS